MADAATAEGLAERAGQQVADGRRLAVDRSAVALAERPPDARQGDGVTWVPLLWGYVIADILIKVFDL